MKIKQKFLTVTMLAVLLFSANNVWAAVCNTLVCPPAPEIDAASGTAAIALLTGVVLYIRKRAKSNSSKSEE